MDLKGYIGFKGVILGLYWDNGKKMETTKRFRVQGFWGLQVCGLKA